MPLLRHILSLVPGIAAAALLLLVLNTPVAAPLVFVGWLVVFIISFTLVSGREARTPTFWFLALPPMILMLGAGSFLFLIENRIVAAAVVAITVLLVSLYGYTHFLFVRLPARYQPYALESLSLGSNLAAFFLVGSASLGFVPLLSLPQWVGASLTFGFGGLLLAETLWVSKVRGNRLPALVFVGALVLAEAAAALVLLPVSWLVSGAALAVLYYLTVGLLRAHALGACDAAVVRRYASVALVAALAVIGTARWV